ncbi:hypothetical protein LP7551_05415 [Roseibium album]|nr:hypothetical protein LP7551_05415 [Roseibium album]
MLGRCQNAINIQHLALAVNEQISDFAWLKRAKAVERHHLVFKLDFLDGFFGAVRKKDWGASYKAAHVFRKVTTAAAVPVAATSVITIGVTALIIA